MKFNSDIPDRIGKFLFFALSGLFLWAFWSTVLKGIAMGELEWFFCFAPGLLSLMPLSAQYQSAPGELTAEGVYVRHFLVRRFYPWSGIVQAGILRRKTKGMPYEIILVKPGGSPRKPGDLTGLFFQRNLIRLIHIPDEPELIDYVTAHLGPLAYDPRGAARR